MFILNIIILLLAVNIDTFFVCFTYGNSKIKIPLVSAITINLICTIFIILPILCGKFISTFISYDVAKTLSCSLLALIGFYKIFSYIIKSFLTKYENTIQYKSFKLSNMRFILQICYEPQIADLDKSKSLSIKEALMVSIALSIDGISVGIGAGLSETNIFWVGIISVVLNFLFIYGGYFIGKLSGNFIKKDVSWVSGLVLIGLGISKLIS